MSSTKLEISLLNSLEEAGSNLGDTPEQDEQDADSQSVFYLPPSFHITGVLLEHSTESSTMVEASFYTHGS